MILSFNEKKPRRNCDSHEMKLAGLECGEGEQLCKAVFTACNSALLAHAINYAWAWWTHPIAAGLLKDITV
jgi:hypothetical protein